MTALPPLLIRDAVPDDLPAIVAIYNCAIPGRRAVADAKPILVEDRATWFYEHDPSRRPLWVLEQHGSIVAWISLQSYSPQLAFRKTAEVSLYVAPGHQRNGHGTLLLSSMIDRCRDLEVDVLMGVAFAHNEATIKLNEKVGFEHWGRLPKVANMGGRCRDLVIMGINILERNQNCR